MNIHEHRPRTFMNIELHSLSRQWRSMVTSSLRGWAWVHRPHLWAPHSGLLLPPTPPHCRGSACGGLIASISPRQACSSETGAAGRAQAAFILLVNKVFRSFSRQRPRFLSHYLPHRQPSLPREQDFFLFYFHGPLYLWVMYFLGFDSFSKGQGSKGRRAAASSPISSTCSAHNPQSSQPAPQSA